MDIGTSSKEATILSLSQDIGKLLADLHDRLDNHFARNPQDAKAEGEKPFTSNVLDEIIENLCDNKAHLSRIMSFVSSEVLPKIN